MMEALPFSDAVIMRTAVLESDVRNTLQLV